VTPGQAHRPPAGGWVDWADAWAEALYGGSGFYRSAAGPAGSFATSSQGIPMVGEVLAGALVELARREGLTSFVDFACGRGELVTRMHRLAPDLSCVGVDVVARPHALPDPVRWVQAGGGPGVPGDLGGALGASGCAAAGGTLVMANEWLDVVPCTVAELDDHLVLRTVQVQPRTGAERLADPLTEADLRWCERHWPMDRCRPGDRVEVGRSRDAAWQGLVAAVSALDRLGPSLVAAVDYGHTAAARPAAGTLTGFRDGVQVAPVPDGSSDLTAHVAMDSLGADEVRDQRAMLRELGVRGTLPDRALSRADPASYLGGLARSFAETALLARGGLGELSWAISRVHPPTGRLPA